MRKLVTAIPVVCLLALTGCGTVGGLPQLDPSVNAKIQQVIQGVRNTCAYQPIASTILNLVNAGSVNEVIGLICGAVNAKSLRRGSSGTLVVRARGKSYVVRGQRL